MPPDSPVYESFYLLWVGGMTGATVATYSVVPAAFIAFSVPALIPPTLYFLSRGDQFHVTVGSVILIFLAFVWISSWRVHKSLVRALELQFENDRLIAYLDREKDRAESLNERLKADIEERKRVERELRRAMEQSQGLARQLRQLSAEDALTGIGNRRRFDEAFEREWSRAMRGHYSISLIMCDLDFFKAYNDHYGHTAGDECLKRVGAVLEQHCRRPGDLAARYGGEEFVVLLPRADAEDARSMAEKIRRAVEDLAMPHAASDVGSMVTTTVGVATLIPDRDMSPKHFLEMADAALYAGKREGRNRVVVSEYLD